MGRGEGRGSGVGRGEGEWVGARGGGKGGEKYEARVTKCFRRGEDCRLIFLFFFLFIFSSLSSMNFVCSWKRGSEKERELKNGASERTERERQI